MANAPATSDETEQCIALTRDGERCSRTAGDGDFCYQHGQSDDTIDEIAADGGTEAESGSESDGGSGSGESESESRDEAETESESDANAETESESESDTDAESDADTDSDADSGDGTETSDIGREGDETVDSDGLEDAAEGTGGESVDIVEVRRIVESTASDLIGRELDGISEIRAEEDGWLVVADLIERPAVPDSQDILGSYELELGPGGAIQGYRRVNRYRRSDTADVE
ncbi:gas vesicle protein GvpO, halophile-type [Halopelagius longus]|uniref:Gas vesicle protein n=1 Tax=Halopelagius longus TaxID=1236180 RepID=A0A1H0XWU1_9EURY|nr:gas vesicle protein GvpO [Halopelagius longus]RDI72137.1 gas vesicle protein [Halopelagius longus]SDQ07281.1 Gas vesicle synthesis protein GvpO [Halopelagius longus]